jgi:hypothetical protein
MAAVGRRINIEVYTCRISSGSSMAVYRVKVGWCPAGGEVDKTAATGGHEQIEMAYMEAKRSKTASV